MDQRVRMLTRTPILPLRALEHRPKRRRSGRSQNKKILPGLSVGRRLPKKMGPA